MKPLDVKKGNGLNSDVFRALKRPGKQHDRISANNDVVAFFLGGDVCSCTAFPRFVCFLFLLGI